MDKKRLSIVFILIANIILLAYTTVPHHHHKSKVCIDNTHCQNDGEAHKHSSTENDHDHDGKNNNECCVLKQIVVIPTNSLRQECICIYCNDNHSPFFDFQFLLQKNEFRPILQFSGIDTNVSLITSSYTYFVNNTSGLRAPPIA